MAKTFYVCDRCGSLRDKRRLEAETFRCDDCGSKALWEFTNPVNAALHSRTIMDKVRVDA